MYKNLNFKIINQKCRLKSKIVGSLIMKTNLEQIIKNRKLSFTITHEFTIVINFKYYVVYLRNVQAIDDLLNNIFYS